MLMQTPCLDSDHHEAMTAALTLGFKQQEAQWDARENPLPVPSVLVLRGPRGLLVITVAKKHSS